MEDHCVNCVSGTLAAGTPTGEYITIGGVQAYSAKPGNATPTSAIVICTDVFGHTLPNVQLNADALAKETGFLCLVPDLFNGDFMPHNALDSFLNPPKGPLPWWKSITRGFELLWMFAGAVPWMYRHHDQTPKIAIMDNVINELRSKGISKIGVIGYCYGGKTVVKLAQAPNKVDTFVAAHPSALSQADFDNVQKPGLFLIAGVDRMFPEASGQKGVNTLTKKGLKSDMKVYPGTKHGFAVRGDESDPTIKQAKQAALDDSIKWFSSML